MRSFVRLAMRTWRNVWRPTHKSWLFLNRQKSWFQKWIIGEVYSIYIGLQYELWSTTNEFLGADYRGVCTYWHCIVIHIAYIQTWWLRLCAISFKCSIAHLYAPSQYSRHLGHSERNEQYNLSIHCNSLTYILSLSTFENRSLDQLEVGNFYLFRCYGFVVVSIRL